MRRSYQNREVQEDEIPSREDLTEMQSGDFIPPDVLDWLNALPYWYEDEHAIYVHAGLVEKNGRFLHPSQTAHPTQPLSAPPLRSFPPRLIAVACAMLETPTTFNPDIAGERLTTST